MKEKIKNRIKNFTLHNVQIFIAYLVVVFYLFTYVYAYKIIYTDGDYSEWYTQQMVYMGKAFSIALATLLILRYKNKILCSVITVINIIIQGMCINEIVSINVYSIRYNSISGNINYFNTPITCMIFIGVLLLLLCIISILILVLNKKHKLSNIVISKKEASKIYIFFIQLINILMVVGLFWLNFMYAMSASNITISDLKMGIDGMLNVWHEFGIYGLVIPFSLLLILINGKLMKKQCFVLAFGMYIIFLFTVKNVIYHLFGANVMSYNNSKFELYEMYFEYKKYVLIAVVILLLIALVVCVKQKKIVNMVSISVLMIVCIPNMSKNNKIEFEIEEYSEEYIEGKLDINLPRTGYVNKGLESEESIYRNVEVYFNESDYEFVVEQIENRENKDEEIYVSEIEDGIFKIVFKEHWLSKFL